MFSYWRELQKAWILQLKRKKKNKKGSLCFLLIASYFTYISWPPEAWLGGESWWISFQMKTFSDHFEMPQIKAAGDVQGVSGVLVHSLSWLDQKGPWGTNCPHTPQSKNLGGPLLPGSPPAPLWAYSFSYVCSGALVRSYQWGWSMVGGWDAPLGLWQSE